jgi:hypothetical protein
MSFRNDLRQSGLFSSTFYVSIRTDDEKQKWVLFNGDVFVMFERLELLRDGHIVLFLVLAEHPLCVITAPIITEGFGYTIAQPR